MFILLFLTLSCNEYNKSKNNEKVVKRNSIVNTDWKDTYNTSIGDPDTSLAIFLWKDTSLSFDINREQYIRYGLEKKKIDNLIRTIYKDEFFLEKRMNSIFRNLDKFDNFIITTIYDNVRNDTVFLSMEVDYFSKRFPLYYRDSFLKKYSVFIW
jgi:hypothetical protein